MQARFMLAEDEILFYLHIPKTAGTSFYTYLERQFPPEQVAPILMIDQLMNKNGLAQLQEYSLNVNPYWLVRGHCDYSIHRLLSKRPVFITMLRNPVDRVISLYKYLRRVPSNPDHQIVKKATLKEFVDGRILQAYNWQCRQISGFINNERGRLAMTNPMYLEVAKENLTNVPFFGLAERFEDSISLLARLFGFRDEPVAKENVAPDDQEIEPLTQDVVDSILEANALDQQLYEFAVQLFEERLKLAQFGIAQYQAASRIHYLFDKTRSELDKTFEKVLLREAH